MVSIDTTKSRIVYHADGKTRDFGFPFRVWKPKEVKVFISYAGMEEEVKTGFSILLSSTGGTVRFNAAPTNGEVIAILRVMPFTQEDEFAQCSRFDPEELETRLDKDCAERQQLLEAVSRAIKLPATSEQTPEEYQADYFQRVENAKTAAKNEIDALANSAKTEIAANRTAAQNAANAANQSKISAQVSQAEIERLLANEIANALRQSLAAASAAKGFAADVEAAVLETGEKATACILSQVEGFARLCREYAASACACSCAAATSNDETWLRVRSMTRAAGEEAAACILEQTNLMAEMSKENAGAAARSAQSAAGFADNMASIIREYSQKTADEIAAQITACIETVCIDSVEMSRSHSMAAAASASAAAGSMQAVVVAVECAAEEASAKAAEMTAQCCQEICNCCIEMSMENSRAAVLAANSAHAYMLEAKQADVCQEAEMRRAADEELTARLDALFASKDGFTDLVAGLMQKIEANSEAILEVTGKIDETDGRLQEEIEALSTQITEIDSLATTANETAVEAGNLASEGIARAEEALTLAEDAGTEAISAKIAANQGLEAAATAQEAAENADVKAEAVAELAQNVVPDSAGELLNYSNGKLNALLQAPNSREIITVSGNWIAKADGYHRVTCIAGGWGGSYQGTFDIHVLRGGRSGVIVEDFIFLEKGQEVPTVIGAGGPHGEYDPSVNSYIGDVIAGGQTSFGSLVAPKYLVDFPSKYFSGQIICESNRVAAYATGGGWGNIYGASPSLYYGAGGSANFDVNPNRFSTYPGVQGCVIVEFFNPDKTEN